MENVEKFFGDALGIIYEGEVFAEDAKPLLRKWEFGYPENTPGIREEIKKIIKEFADFFVERDKKKLDITGHIALYGDIYGRKGFKDGEYIHTSDVVSFERINKGDLNGGPRDLMCANTESGSRYYFYSDDHSADMFLILGAAIHMC